MKKPLLAILIAGILLVAVSGSLCVYYMVNRLAHFRSICHIPPEMVENPPISFEPDSERRIVHQIDAITLLVHRPTGAGNAARSYMELIRSMEERDAHKAEESTRQSPAETSILTDEELLTFLEGVNQIDCDFSQESLVLDGKSVRLAPAVDVADNLAHLSWFRRISRAVVARGELYESSEEYEQALRCYEGVVKFGSDIEKGRESLLQVFVGAAVQKSGASKLKEYYETVGDGERLQLWNAYLEDLDEFAGKFKRKARKVSGTSWATPEAIANALWVLKHDEDHIFKREVLAGLGAARLFSPDIIGPALEEVAASDPDPYVREAAQNALKMADSSKERP